MRGARTALAARSGSVHRVGNSDLVAAPRVGERIDDPVIAARPAANGHRRFMCRGCYYIYEEAHGLPAQSIPAGTSFADIPSAWRCPDCGTEKTTFRPYVDSPDKAALRNQA